MKRCMNNWLASTLDSHIYYKDPFPACQISSHGIEWFIFLFKQIDRSQITLKLNKNYYPFYINSLD